jgi:hypothetical protein
LGRKAGGMTRDDYYGIGTAWQDLDARGPRFRQSAWQL